MQPIKTCASVAVFVFAVLLLMMVLVAADAIDPPYYLNHLVIALLIFLLASGIHHAVVHRYQLTDGNWLMGFFSAFPFYLSREIRDSEKLGHWDWAGLWWPTAGLLVVFAALETGTALWRRSKAKAAASGADMARLGHHTT